MEKLPTEVLAGIFVTSTYGNQYPEVFYNIRASICSVCRYWGDIATSYQPLWSLVFVDTITAFPPANLVKLHAERSGMHPLKIHVQASFWESKRKLLPKKTQAKYLEKVIDILSLHIRRWWRLIVIQDRGPAGELPWGKLVHVPFSRADNLENVEIKLIDDFYRPSTKDWGIIEALGKLSSLKQLVWRTSGNLGSLIPALSWEQLDQLTLKGPIRWMQNFPIFAHCASATLLNIKCDQPAHLIQPGLVIKSLCRTSASSLST